MQPTGPKRPAADGQRRWAAMIPHSEFQQMRLADFVPDVTPLSDWQFMGRTWVGQAVGFTEWLMPEDSPAKLGAISLDLVDLPRAVSETVLVRLGLALRRGMTASEVGAVLGACRSTDRFVEDRLSHNFQVGTVDRYSVSCTIHRDDGLIYVQVMPVAR
jgi:hypothetical protein